MIGHLCFVLKVLLPRGCATMRYIRQLVLQLSFACQCKHAADVSSAIILGQLRQNDKLSVQHVQLV